MTQMHEMTDSEIHKFVEPLTNKLYEFSKDIEKFVEDHELSPSEIHIVSDILNGALGAYSARIIINNTIKRNKEEREQ